MTKKEKVELLREQLRKEYEEDLHKPELLPEYLELEDWMSMHVEFESPKDIKEMAEHVGERLAHRTYNSIHGGGEYEVFFLVRRKGDFQRSPEANERRQKMVDRQQELGKKMRLGLAKIELEHPDD